jgi:hypothetical protein
VWPVLTAYHICGKICNMPAAAHVQEASGEARPKEAKQSKKDNSSALVAGIVAVIASALLVAALVGVLLWRRRHIARKAAKRARATHALELGTGFPGASTQVLVKLEWPYCHEDEFISFHSPNRS